MPTKPLERLMFAQGGLCFFCNALLPKDEASVEHLVPTARAGSNSDDNCVATCKALNALLGSMSLKEKIRVFLLQKGDFKCPNGTDSYTISAPALLALPAPVVESPVSPVVVAASATPKAPTAPTKDALAVVVKDLKGRGKSKPLRVKTLTSTIKALPLGLSDREVQALIDKLIAQGKIVVSGTKVAYKL